MITKYPHIQFKAFKERAGYDCWSVGGTHLGTVELDSYFKRWNFIHRSSFHDDLFLSSGIINDIGHFMNQLKGGECL